MEMLLHLTDPPGPLELRTLSDNLVQAQQMINPGPFKAPVQVTRVPPRVQELCKSWLQTGMCTIRGQCGAAHSLNELSAAGPVTKPHQVQPCRNLKDKGHCPYGNNCQFSHSLQVGHKSSLKMRLLLNLRLFQDSPTVKPVKVVLCQDFNNGGHCDKGSSCTFAHGLMELHEYRTKQVQTNFVTLYFLFYLYTHYRSRITELLSVRLGTPKARVCTERRVCTLMEATNFVTSLLLVAPMVVVLDTLFWVEVGLLDILTLVLVVCQIVRE